MPITVHLFDKDQKKIQQLNQTLEQDNWDIPGVTINCHVITFQDALAAHNHLLTDKKQAKLLIIDQCGVDEVSDDIFKVLITFPTTDFIFFLSSSTLHRFRNHPAIKQKIEMLDDAHDVHRATLNYFRNLVPAGNKVFLAPFSIRKRSNIYGLIFGSRHPLGIHKFLQVAWANDEIAGEANFDIERENIRPGEGILPFDVMRPNKVQVFEQALESSIRSGHMKSEADVVRFCIEAGMTSQHSVRILKKLKDEGVIEIDFRVPDVRKLNGPRPIRMA
jgi:hypothetical protein